MTQQPPTPPGYPPQQAPGPKTSSRAVAMNAALDDMHLDAVRDAGRTVLFFACAAGLRTRRAAALPPDRMPYTGGVQISLGAILIGFVA